MCTGDAWFSWVHVHAALSTPHDNVLVFPGCSRMALRILSSASVTSTCWQRCCAAVGRACGRSLTGNVGSSTPWPSWLSRSVRLLHHRDRYLHLYMAHALHPGGKRGMKQHGYRDSVQWSKTRLLFFKEYKGWWENLRSNCMKNVSLPGLPPSKCLWSELNCQLAW